MFIQHVFEYFNRKPHSIQIIFDGMRLSASCRRRQKVRAAGARHDEHQRRATVALSVADDVWAYERVIPTKRLISMCEARFVEGVRKDNDMCMSVNAALS